MNCNFGFKTLTVHLSKTHSGNWIIRWVLLLIAVAVALGIGQVVIAPWYIQRTIRLAEELIAHGKSDEALRVLQPVIDQSPNNGEACYLAGVASSRRKQFQPAIEWFSQVPYGHPRRSEACFLAADLQLLQFHKLTTAEALLHECLADQPGHHAAQGHLAGIYGLCGLTSLSTRLRFDRIIADQFAEVDLMLLALGDTAAENADSLNKYFEASPDDPLTLIARGHQRWQQHDYTSAQEFYLRGKTARPELVDAQARLGRIYCEESNPPAFLAWHSQLDSPASDASEIWAVRGDWSVLVGDIAGGVRCYWEAARRDPVHRRAHHQLGQLLSQLGEPELAEPFQRRNAGLQELLLAAKQTGLDRSSTALLRAVKAAEACDHPWEAWGWGRVALHRFPTETTLFRPFRPEVGTPRVPVDAQPACNVDLTRYPLPRWMQAAASDQDSSADIVQDVPTTIHFRDEAGHVGIDFSYLNGDEYPGPGMRIFQFAGGGVGVLDYDRDGWPDLYFTQGGRWPVAEAQPPSDVLFRNRRGQRFEDISITAGILEQDYSQGITIGDIDGDGWEDILVANVAGNRLFQNNGDGTFRDITVESGVGDSAWSTSVVCADFNGDSLPDLFVVNYLEGDDLLSRICHQANGEIRACTPHEFAAAEDQLLLNQGDGRFLDVSREAGIIAPGGKGLGVVAADFDGSGKLSLFVGNDTTANFFFHNVTSMPGGLPQFQETAVVSGLAFDQEGRSLACMGIAADDANGDGQLDLFVTNYYNESNTFYERQSGLMFTDVTSAAGLREPSIKQLGFGTQFLDADLDGWSDLVVTNGHVDDETRRGIPLHMPTQFFHNRGNGRFVEVPAKNLGPWFEGKYLGRGLARLDWNRDGLDDFAVSHLDSPAALLTNESQPKGRYLSIQMIATESARDAIGTIVHVTTSERTVVRQLTAGDGYQASNERRLTFAVDGDESVQVTIQWPSGKKISYSDVPTQSGWIAIEGRDHLVEFHRNSRDR